MPGPDPGPGFSGPRPRSRLDGLPAEALLERVLAFLGVGSGRAAWLLRTDLRTVQRMRAGVRDVLPRQWLELAAGLEARAALEGEPYRRHALELARACWKKADPSGDFREKRQ